MPPEIPTEAVQAAANTALAARIAREASSPVQGPVKECPQSAPGSTESAQTPTSRVSVPPEGAEGISEPHGEHDELAAARVRADVAEVVIRDLRAAVARVRALADRWGVTDPGARDEILATLDGPPAVPEQAGEPATPDHEVYILPRAPLTVEDCEALGALLAARAAAARTPGPTQEDPCRSPEV